MPEQDQLRIGWDDLKSKVRDAWSQLGEEDLSAFQGDLQQLVGWIQQRTGQSGEEIANCLAGLDERFRPVLKQFASAARECYDHASTASAETVDRLREGVEVRRARAELAVRKHPMESVAVAFGAGVVAGALVALVLRSK
ncbi:hypothetical protein KOR34_20790 [Posidoniimonas corsicana]|uniref:DUF883 domain-containing protein n=1 Tax=Posidoniimonas corsicana TaxID=1938618 RepID=A0A5C5VHI1_9BACT|nr:hypothetical protein [Posidoniimonas corsicana]TWT37132.1 hypothetical protein KOR34_20790 [Posidoniimonas corsicana]